MDHGLRYAMFTCIIQICIVLYCANAIDPGKYATILYLFAQQSVNSEYIKYCCWLSAHANYSPLRGHAKFNVLSHDGSSWHMESTSGLPYFVTMNAQLSLCSYIIIYFFF